MIYKISALKFRATRGSNRSSTLKIRRTFYRESIRKAGNLIFILIYIDEEIYLFILSDAIVVLQVTLFIIENVPRNP